MGLIEGGVNEALDVRMPGDKPQRTISFWFGALCSKGLELQAFEV